MSVTETRLGQGGYNAGRFGRTIVLTGDGDWTYTPPFNLDFIEADVIAGGGGGGDAAAVAGAAGGGGSGGNRVRKILTKDEIGTSILMHVGAGGLASANGADSSIGSLAVAKGGIAGADGTDGTTNQLGGEATGTGNVGDLILLGDAGESSVAGDKSGKGGAAPGGGGGGGSKLAAANGVTGRNYGGGGGGAYSGGSAQTGGVGGAGVIIITEYFAR